MTRSNNETLNKFYAFCQRNRIPEAMIKAIPYIGDSLHELLYGSDIEKLIQRVSSETLERQKRIIVKLEEIMEHINNGSPKCEGIVAIGGANMEYLYVLSSEILIGQKNPVKEAKELMGGGGLNFTSRLLAAGHQLFPILAVGSDHSGNLIQQELLKLARRSRQSEIIQNFIEDKKFFIPGIKTATATIVIQGSKRTILSFTSAGNAQSFKEHIKDRFTEIENILGCIPALIRISHLQNYDGKDSSNELTKQLINSYSNKSMIYFNPGISQIESGINYWENTMQKCDVVQFNLSEAKRLFAKDGYSTSLVNIMQWFIERQITVVITMAKFGAVGIYKSGKDGIVFSLPAEIEDSDVVDPTGAGDAFSAGIVSELHAQPEFSFQDFHRSIDSGRFWSTYACLNYGGSGDCPDNDTITGFRKKLESEFYNPTQVAHRSQADGYLRLIDKAYY